MFLCYALVHAIASIFIIYMYLPDPAKVEFGHETKKRNQAVSIKESTIPILDKGPIVTLKGTTSAPCHFAFEVRRPLARDKVNHCDTLSLPLHSDSSIPPKCWPRFILLPSFPTGGNELAQNLFQEVTGLLTGTIYGDGLEMSFFRRGPVIPRKVTTQITSEKPVTDFEVYMNHTLPCHSSFLTLPFKNRAAVVKTHYPVLSFRYNQSSQTWSNNDPDPTSGGILSGVVRLARNPGDQMFRNNYRWNSGTDGYCREKSCFIEKAKPYCKSMNMNLGKWIGFHEYWNHYNSSIPQIVLHYEHLSQPQLSPNAMRRMLAFANETLDSELKKRFTLGEVVQKIIKPPDYEHGTLLAEVCGVDTARYLHNQTKHITTKLGYQFDEETGVWTLPTDIYGEI